MTALILFTGVKSSVVCRSSALLVSKTRAFNSLAWFISMEIFQFRWISGSMVMSMSPAISFDPLPKHMSCLDFGAKLDDRGAKEQEEVAV
ncbi:hypothetical protein Tco_0363123 [Tanacetum coccineum]